MLTKHCLQEFILDCQLRRLSPRTVKGYHNNTHNFLIYSEKHYEITEVEEIRTVHIKQYIQYLLNKKLTASLHQRDFEMSACILPLRCPRGIHLCKSHRQGTNAEGTQGFDSNLQR